MPVNEIERPKRDRLHRKFPPAGVAMQHGAKRSLGHFVFEDAAAILVGFAGMNDQRQAGRAGRRDMGAKAALLRFARAVLVEIIQPRLAERHDLGMPRQLDQFARGNAVFFVGVMRMGADRAIDVGKPLRDREQRAEPPHPRRDRDDAPDAGGGGARHDAVEIVGEIREIEMAVAVDQHRVQTVHAAVGSI